MSKEFENKVLDFITVAQKRFDNLEGRFDNLEERIDNLEGRFDNLEERIDNLEGRFDNLEERIDNLEGKFDNLHESVVLIEDKVMTEFPALLEAFDLHKEMHKDYDEKNSYLSVKLEEESMRISVLEDQIKFLKNN